MPVVELTGVYAELDDLLRLRHLRLRKRRVGPLKRGRQGGTRQSRLRGRGMDFAEVRAYQPGDDIRAIDWRVTARKAKPHTKIFREERERPTLVLADQTQSLFFGTRIRLKSVAAAEAAALLSWHALDNGDRVGGIVVDNDGEHVFRPYRSARALVRLLNRLSLSNRRLHRQRDTPGQERLLTALEHLQRLAPSGHRIYLISDLAGLDTAHEQRLTRIARHNSVVVLWVHDLMERELPPPGHYFVTDGVARLALDTSNDKLRSHYRALFDERLARLTRICQRTGMQLIPIATDEAIADQIAARLSRS